MKFIVHKNQFSNSFEAYKVKQQNVELEWNKVAKFAADAAAHITSSPVHKKYFSNAFELFWFNNLTWQICIHLRIV